MAPSRPGPAITATWVWDSPVAPDVDPRGGGYAPAAASRLAAFARAAGLREVHVLAPAGEGAGAGPVEDWWRATVDALHDVGVSVSAVAEARDATAGWAEAVTATAPFDRLQVVTTTWTRPGTGPTASPPGAVPAALRAVPAALRAVRDGAGPTPVDACVPWWFATEAAAGAPQGAVGGSLLEQVLAVADHLVLAAPAAHAEGPGGVLDLAAPALDVLTAAGRPFTVAVETGTPDAAGGVEHTFYEEGPVALIRECAVVAARLARAPGFGGVAVRSHRTWRRLLGV